MRRLRNILPFVILVALMFTSCEKEANIETVNVPINFSNHVSTLSRAADITTGNLTSIGVFAYFTHGNFNEASLPNFMYNQLVEKKSGTWQYSPVKYWPNNNSDKISFFAYAPYNASGVTLSTEDKAGRPALNYTVPSTEAEQTDLLAAVPVMNQNTGPVNFNLNHTLTKIAIYVKSNDNTPGKIITAFSIKADKRGTLTYNMPTVDNPKGFAWSSALAKQTFTATATAFSVPDNSTDEKILLSTFFLFPRGEGNTFNITYTYPGAGDTKETVTLNNQPLPALDKWEPGAFVSYTLGIEKKVGVTVTTNSRPEWENGDSEKVDGVIEGSTW